MEKNIKEIKEYDDKGNTIHGKRSKGFEYWLDYDERGNIIHYKDSDKNEEWYKYDEKGNVLYFKDQNGKIYENNNRRNIIEFL